MRRFLRIVSMGFAVCACVVAGACGNGARDAEDPVPDGGADTGPSIEPDAVSFGDVTNDAPDTGPVNLCKVNEDQETVPDCEGEARPPNSFAPRVKWEWEIPSSGSGYNGSMVTPLVANMTDDNGDGAVDLCDTPDVIVASNGGPPAAAGKLYMLDGRTGELELTFEGTIDGSVNPALGDVDNDGIPDVVAADTDGRIAVYGNDGVRKVKGAVAGYRGVNASYCNAIALYDLDADGNVEIIAGFEVFDRDGQRLFGVDGNNAMYNGHYWCPTPTAADLDGDGTLEVIFGNVTMHADGTEYWTLSGPPGQPHVANLDSDPEPEVFIAREDGLFVLEHNGTVKFGPLQLTQKVVSPNCWSKPGAIHDFDGDGIAEIAASSCQDYSVYKVLDTGLEILWTAAVSDMSGLATGTAFDFLGRGIADAIYADEQKAYVFDGETGEIHFTVPRTSGTLIEYPVVADIDNDRSADVLVVSNGQTGKIVAYEDEEKRWIPSRRIWNQHAYHVTNVLEDGRIPRRMKPNWKLLNTFRTNAQRNQDGDCRPPPPNPPK